MAMQTLKKASYPENDNLPTREAAMTAFAKSWRRE